MKKVIDLGGQWNGYADNLGNFTVMLPGTLDTNKIGVKDEKNLATRLTRVHTYEGQVSYSRKIYVSECSQGKRLFLKVERTRELSLKINGEEQIPYEAGSLSTPFLFEVTRFAGREAEYVFTVDNVYTKWPRKSIIGSSAATDETQTNWNGILGDFYIYEENEVFISSISVYPNEIGADVCIEVDGINEKSNKNLLLTIESPAFSEDKTVLESTEWKKDLDETEKNRMACRVIGIPYDQSVKRWDEGEGNQYQVTVSILMQNEKVTENIDERIIYFGIRTFGKEESQRLVINGRKFFLRGEANCCVFPEEGHPPVTEEAWTKVLEVYESYGVNCMRFHSWCPPEAAFDAADKMGMMMQPELSQWNFKDAFGDEDARKYYRHELESVLKNLANHPSFLMLTFGNELQNTEEGDIYVAELLDLARELDSTRMYAKSSNYHYGELGTDDESDFYTSMAYFEEMLRATSSPMIGHLNHEYPSTKHNYDETVNKVCGKGKPVFAFEVGQYEILPDFDEIPEFKGVTRAVNFELIKKKAEQEGILPVWKKYVEATGELSLLCYKEETEAALRTGGMSGLSLLGLQDFPGQGTALVGMLNCHLEPKSFNFAKPERFREFFNDVVPLLYLDKFTYWSEEKLSAQFCLANYGKKNLKLKAGWKLTENDKIIASGEFEESDYLCGEVISGGVIEVTVPQTETALRMNLELYAGEYKNSYPIWSYAKKKEVAPSEMVNTVLTEALIQEIKKGKTVFLEPSPTKENFPESIGGQFTTDFWSVGTFPMQEGGMGMVIEKEHPALAEFPTEIHSNYQWWSMASKRPMILPSQIMPIVTVPDSYSRMKHMGLLFEASLGKGRVMISSMGLLENQKYPECRGLLYSLLDYLEQNEEKVSQMIDEDELKRIISVQTDGEMNGNEDKEKLQGEKK
ncbi:glycoside hydrolase family 2 TIM barrel-domain containing protein [Clostridium sp. C105KSO13]|uniref:glycoside hydrolase family 2 TIM barrel-domain containing protein n=1 Tax=Clostridium sp. C105KSO13 TaxID=1776045 RepID=UPI0007406A74|nr:glycoside hydrolase family 2 TIM barrel-domain containing protein [Clostridium sp. C105KSO13]CUX35356.1 Beta-galactosidase [Clostridium sp. C105KSO13]